MRSQENVNTFTYNIVERIPHPNYSRKHADNDISLFKLQKAVEINDYVIPICLPQGDILTTRRAIATGWGKTGYSDNVSESLMKVVIDYFDKPSCEETYLYSGKLASGSIDWDRMLCAGSTNKTGDTVIYKINKIN